MKITPPSFFPFPEFNQGEHGMNVVTTSTKVEHYPCLAWMNISVAKLRYFASQKFNYIFDCFINEERLVYICSAEELESRLVESQCNVITTHPSLPRYSFYIEYASGTLRRNPGDDALMSLERVTEKDDTYSLNMRIMPQMPEIYKYVICQALASGCSNEVAVYRDYQIREPLMEELGDWNGTYIDREIEQLIAKDVFRKYGTRIKFSSRGWRIFGPFASDVVHADNLDRIAIAYQQMNR